MIQRERAESIIGTTIKDLGITGYLLCLEQLTWIFHLRYLDGAEFEKLSDTLNIKFDETYRWSNWACPKLADGSADLSKTLNDDELIDFVNNKLFPYLRQLSLKLTADNNAAKDSLFSELIFTFQTMKNRFVAGCYLRIVLDLVDEVELDENSEFSDFAQFYEMILEVIASKNYPSYQYSIPRPLVRAIVKVINPLIGESVYDAASGTCDFLMGTLKHIMKEKNEYSDLQRKRLLLENSVGREIDSYANIFGRTNLIFHTGLQPNTFCENALVHNVNEITEKDQFDIVLTKLPYGSEVDSDLQKNVPIEHKSQLLTYLQHMMHSLKPNGRAAVIIPDEVLSKAENEFKLVRQELLEKFNLHSILSLPSGIFWPFSHLKFSVLFFNRSGKTSNIWYYETGLKLELSRNTEVFDENFAEFVDLFFIRERTKNSWKVPYSEINEDINLSPRNPNKKDEETELEKEAKKKRIIAKIGQYSRLVEDCNFNLVQKLNLWFEGVSPRRLIGELVSVKGGRRVPKGEKLQDEKSEHPFVRISDFTNYGSISTKDIKYLSENAYERMKSGAVSTNDLCISIVGTIGKVCIVPDELDGAILTDNAAKIIMKDESELNLRYLYLFSLTDDFKKQAGNATRSVAQPKLALSRFEKIEIPVCSILRQLEMVNDVWKIKSAIDESEKKIQELELTNLEEIHELIEKLDKTNKSINELVLPSGEENIAKIPATVIKGTSYDTSVKSHFASMMLANESISDFLGGAIHKMQFQGKIDGFSTDDMILYVSDPATKKEYKVVGYVEEKIEYSEERSFLIDLVYYAWKDLNNSDVFSRGQDAIALITNPSDSSIQQDVQFLCNFAMHFDDATEYFRTLRVSKLGNSEIFKLIEIIRSRLTLSKNFIEATDDEIFDFFKHFHIFEYDYAKRFDYAHSILRPDKLEFVNEQNIHKFNLGLIYSSIVNAVHSCGNSSNTLTKEKLTNDIKLVFDTQEESETPNNLLESEGEVETILERNSDSEDLPLLALIGSWSGSNKHDHKILTKFLGKNYLDWMSKLSEISHLPDSPISIRCGIWSVSKREVHFDSINTKILDKKLGEFKDIALEVLGEQNSRVGISPFQIFNEDETFENPKYSDSIRRGISEGLAILGNFAELSKKSQTSSKSKASVSRIIVKKLLQSADWRLWCTLNELLPNIAEAAPEEFLSQVFNALEDKSRPFYKIFVLDSNEIVTESFIKGLFWALESLAWDEKYMERVCLCLCELYNHAEQGKRLKTPLKSLTEILSPWSPRTAASVELRKVVIRNIVEKYNDAGWSLLVGLLPSQKSWISFPTHEPKWRKIKFAGKQIVSKQEYTDQNNFIAELAVWMAERNPNRILHLVEIIEVLPEPAFQKFVAMFSTDTFASLIESEKKIIWESLKKCILKHSQFPKADWTLSDEKFEKIEAIANMLEPDDPFTRYQYLFSGNDSDLFIKLDSWEEKEKELSERRVRAIKELYERDGLDRVLEFKDKVELPNLVGIALAATGDDKIDKEIINEENLLSSEASTTKFVGGYISERHRLNGWKWVESILKASMNKDGTIKFLSFLPFEQENWELARKTVGGNDGRYWKSIPSNIYLPKSRNLEVAVENLLNFGRPKFAVRCLEKMKRDGILIDVNLCIGALKEAKKSDEFEPPFFQRIACDLIKHLQGDSKVNIDELSDVEWAYLQDILEQDDVNPDTLYKRLSVDPDFFCEIISIAYISTFEDQQPRELEQNERDDASNAYSLLEKWTSILDRIPDKFQNWLRRVRSICEKSGHLEIAFHYVGRMLSKITVASDKIRIDRSIADILEKELSDDMLEGFRIGLSEINAAPVDIPYGEFELMKAEEFLDIANTIQKENYPRLANTLRKISNNYKQDAEIAFSRYAAE